MIVKDLCNHLKSRSISYTQFRNNNYKVNTKPVNKFSEFVPIKFISRELESMQINSILNDPDAMKLFPSKDLNKKFQNKDFKFSTCFKYEKAIRADLVNYKENILCDDPISDVKCFCHLHADFVDPSVGHVITGDVSIVKNGKLRKLFKKGYTFIEPVYQSKLAIFGSIKSDINNYVKKLSARCSLSIRLFDGWKVTVLDKLRTKVFNSKIFCKRNQSILVSEAEDLSLLKQHFIMTSVDKASNNISFICKKYYLENIKHELSTTSTYVLSNDSEACAILLQI